MNLSNAREEEIKNIVAKEFFNSFDCTKIIGNIDFCVTQKPTKRQSLNEEYQGLEQGLRVYLWAEAKRGTRQDIYASFVQLILTIGKAKTHAVYTPPLFLSAFDAEKIAFIRWNKIQEVFALNDFNWNITASDHESKHFQQLYSLIKQTLEKESYLFFYSQDAKELKDFIKANFVFENLSNQKQRVDKNNFVFVYNKWLSVVKPTISIVWDSAKKRNILDADFYLADLISDSDQSLLESLRVVLEHDKYRLRYDKDDLGDLFREYSFNDNQKGYNAFWHRYERPPKKEYWEYIIDRRDLLVPQDFRERKGSFFTPKQWVELSQSYLAETFGEDWQDEYYIWDCAAGTGNLLNGLTNKYNVFASTLDMADVNVMHELINSGVNLVKDHVFQFDFLNDEFDCGKLPEDLLKIINDKEKRKKLIIYINPPYAEATASYTIIGNNRHKEGLSKTVSYKKYLSLLGRGVNEVFAQFFIRIYQEIPGCRLAEFSKLKILQAGNFKDFRNVFRAKLERLFLIPADTFDNVKGQFPIGFFIWDTSKKEEFRTIIADVYNKEGYFFCKKTVSAPQNNGVILNWMQNYYDKQGERIAYMVRGASDFQNNKIVFIKIQPSNAVINYSRTHNITKNNLIENCIFFAVRHCIKPTWLNDRDQFLYPKDGWQKDKEFLTDCLAYTILHDANNIKSSEGINHWIPFREEEVGAKGLYDSHFMIDFIAGKIQAGKNEYLFNNRENEQKRNEPLIFSTEALRVLDAGREIWRYYHQRENVNPNASYYDIREYFQGRNPKGKMNNRSTDERYNELVSALRDRQKALADKIASKTYKYEFLL